MGAVEDQQWWRGTCDSLGGRKTDFLSEPGNWALINDYLVITAFLAISKSSAVN
jgi:hypothetical protein